MGPATNAKHQRHQRSVGLPLTRRVDSFDDSLENGSMSRRDQESRGFDPERSPASREREGGGGGGGGHHVKSSSAYSYRAADYDPGSSGGEVGGQSSSSSRSREIASTSSSSQGRVDRVEVDYPPGGGGGDFPSGRAAIPALPPGILVDREVEVGMNASTGRRSSFEGGKKVSFLDENHQDGEHWMRGGASSSEEGGPKASSAGESLAKVSSAGAPIGPAKGGKGGTNPTTSDAKALEAELLKRWIIPPRKREKIIWDLLIGGHRVMMC